MAPTETASSAQRAYLLLDVAGTPCALPRAEAGEILPVPDLFRPFAAGGWLAGFLNLGGSAVPVIDLARLMGLRTGEHHPGLYDHLVLLAEGRTAILVDRVSDLVSVPLEQVRAVGPEHAFNGCVAAEITLGEQVVQGLAVARILTVEERVRVEALTRLADARLAALPAA